MENYAAGMHQKLSESPTALDHSYSSESATVTAEIPDASTSGKRKRCSSTESFLSEAKRCCTETVKDEEIIETMLSCSSADAVHSSSGIKGSDCVDPVSSTPVKSCIYEKGNIDGEVENIAENVVIKNEDSLAAMPITSIENKPSSMFGNVGMTEQEIDEIIDGLGDDIDSLLEEKAEKNKLTVKNVKSILRHVITNEYVLAMVRNTMKSEESDDNDFEEIPFEPKLTRSKAKELREKQATLPWPVSSPAKSNSELSSKKLLDQEFPEDSSSDEEYKPNEEECHSGDDDSSSTKGCQKSPPAFDIGEAFSPLVIAESEPLESDRNTEADLIALRTRSKLPLKDTPLEAIEASFVAPDITVDMYNTECDDEEWKQFLRELSKPFDAVASAEQPDEDDPINDPEYNFLEEEEVPDEEEWDLGNDQSVQVSRTEMKDLMTEILEAAEIELYEMEDEEEEPSAKEEHDSSLNCGLNQSLETEPSSAVDTSIEVADGNSEHPLSSWMTEEERLQLDEQMRMHVQLLCQSYILSSGVPELTEVNSAVESLLLELQMFACKELITGKRSAFHAHNLNGAVDILKSIKAKGGITVKESDNRSCTKSPPALPDEAKGIMAWSAVFIYPELLPSVGFRRFVSHCKKVTFTRAEDNLIVLGLDQFSFAKKPIQLTQSLLVSAKTELQIKIRIKNAKSPLSPDDNPIKRYYKYNELPSFPRDLKPFDPSNVKRPCDFPPEVLPQWINNFISKPPQPVQPRPLAKAAPKVAVVPPIISKPVPKRKYPPILPRVYVSPLKQISPILKKYVQHRRVVPIAPFCAVAPMKPVGFTKKQSRRPLKPKAPSLVGSVIPISVGSNSGDYAESYSVMIPHSLKQPVSSLRSPSVASLSQTDAQFSEAQGPQSMSVTTSGQYSESEKDLRSVTAEMSENCGDESDRSNNIVSNNHGNDLDSTSNHRTESDSIQEIDACEDADDEAIDDEQDLATLMAASSTICKKQRSMIKKKNKHQRDLESTLALLSPHLMESDPKKEDREKLFAQSYLLRVMEALKDTPEKCEKFLKLLCSYEHSTKSPVRLFTEVQELLKDHPTLVDDFAGFLLPEQAKDCGKYVQHTVLSKIRSFLRKVEVHFMNQPHQIQRILRSLSQLQQQADITSQAVIEAVTPLLRNQSHLLEEFMQLFPKEAPPECLMTDFEEVKIPNCDADNSSCDSVESITIPETPDPYGCKDCPCSCHTLTVDARMQNRSRHCVKCGTKFLDGRIYIQTGKVLKPAQVVYRTPEGHKSSLNQFPTSERSGSQKISQESDKSQPSSASSEQQQVQDHADVSAENQALNSACVQNPETDATSTAEDMTDIRATKGILDIVTDDLVPESCSSLLPCGVTEDAVLPPDSSSLNSVPSDFSRLREVISPKSPADTDRDCSDIQFTYESGARDADETENTCCDVTTETAGILRIEQNLCRTSATGNFSAEIATTNKDNSNSRETRHLNSDSSGRTVTCPAQGGETWTREQDKILLETCQLHGITQEAFSIAAKSVGCKSVHEVEMRVMELMQLLRKRLNSADS